MFLWWNWPVFITAMEHTSLRLITAKPLYNNNALLPKINCLNIAFLSLSLTLSLAVWLSHSMSHSYYRPSPSHLSPCLTPFSLSHLPLPVSPPSFCLTSLFLSRPPVSFLLCSLLIFLLSIQIWCVFYRLFDTDIWKHLYSGTGETHVFSYQRIYSWTVVLHCKCMMIAIIM